MLQAQNTLNILIIVRAVFSTWIRPDGNGSLLLVYARHPTEVLYTARMHTRFTILCTLLLCLKLALIIFQTEAFGLQQFYEFSYINIPQLTRQVH